MSGPSPRSVTGHSQRIEAHAELILSAVAAKSDITLAELQAWLKERGGAVGHPFGPKVLPMSPV